MSSNEPTDRTSPVTHRLRRAAESFGVDAKRYDRTRQPYPDSLVASIVAAAPGREVLDVGCGTGIVARQFQAAGCTVLEMEPDPRMAQFARRRGLTVDQARFEDWDPAGRRFDAVVAGTVWHWVYPDAGCAKAADAIRRVGAFTEPRRPVRRGRCALSAEPRIHRHCPDHRSRVVRMIGLASTPPTPCQRAWR